MIADKRAPEINAEKLMKEIREEIPRRSRARASAQTSTQGIGFDLDDVAVELGRAPPGSPLPEVQLLIPDLEWHSLPVPPSVTRGTADHLRDFAAYDDADLVQAAYQAILKRDADEEGLRCYLTMLRQGASKAEILYRIYRSPEGRQGGAKIGGLRLHYVLDSISRWPVVGRVIAVAIAVWNLPATERDNRRQSCELARRLAQDEQSSVQLAKSATEVHRRLESSHIALANMTKMFATRAHSASLQQALTRTVTSLQALQRAARTHVDKVPFDAQIDELWENLSTKADAAAVETASQSSVNELDRRLDSLEEFKADRAVIDTLKMEVNDTFELVNRKWTNRLDQMATEKADQAAIAALCVELNAAYQETAITAQTILGQVQAISDTKVDRRDSERWANDVAASVSELGIRLDSLGQSKADKVAMMAIRSEIIAALQHSSSDAKIMSHELNAEVGRKLESLEKSKADRAVIDTLKMEVNDTLELVNQKWTNRLDQVATEKADHAAMGALRVELNAAYEESAIAAKTALQQIQALSETNESVAKKLELLQESKANAVAMQKLDAFFLTAMDTKTERHELTALTNHLVTLLEHRATTADFEIVRSEIAVARDAIDEVRRDKADQAAIYALSVELKAADEESIATAKTALQLVQLISETKIDRRDSERWTNDMSTSVNKLHRKLESLSQSKADLSAISALRSELIAALDHSSTTAKSVSRELSAEVDRKLDSFKQATAERGAIDALKIEVNDALELANRNWSDRLHRVATEKADNALVETLKVETRVAIAQHQKGAAEALSSALATVNSRAHDLKINVLDQDRRVGHLLEEARKRLPRLLSTAQVAAMLTEDDHRLDAMYASFEDRFRGTRADIRRRQAIYLAYVREAKAGTTDAPVIDLGCGRGEWLELLRDEGLAARGVDLNRVFLDGCRELKLDVSEQDALVFLRQLKRNSVGVVSSFHMIEHLDHKILIALLDETLRVLKPGGIAIFETPNPRNLVVGSCNFYLDPTHKHPLPPDLSRYLLEARGFSRVEVRELHACPPEQMIAEGSGKVREALNNMLYSFQDYAVIGRKV